MLPNEIAGKYELRGTLGAGAMGTVYEAVDRMIERRVAIKVVKLPAAGDEEGEEAHARFRREAQAAGRLSHNNIVGVYDYGENAETAWIVMELVEGGSLKDRLDRKERFPVAEIARLMDGVLAALAYSHGRGVVHRDIKPANIMLGLDGTVKMADFGIARLENSSMTQVGTVMGTPSYMAPEQLRGETVDARADIWASGVMLYQLLTGEKPFDGGLAAMMHKAMNTEPVPPSQLAVTCPRAFDAVVANALAKRPEDRWPNALAFAEAIRNAATGQAPAPPSYAFAEADSEATMFVGSRTAAAPVARLADPFDAAPSAPAAPPPSPPQAPAAAPPAGKSRLPLIAGGGVAALIAAGVAGFLLFGGESTPPVVAPPPPVAVDARAQEVERQRLAAEEEARRAAAATQSQAAEAEAQRRAQEETARAAAAAEDARRQAQLQAMSEAERRQAEARAREEAARQAAAAAQAQQEEERRRAEQLRSNLQQAGAAAAATPCSLLTWSATPTTLTVSGVVRRGDEAAVRQAVAARGLPADAVRLQLASFDGPYCQALDLVRPIVAAPDGAPLVSLVGTQPLAKGDLLRLEVTMPPTPSQLYVAYLMQSGEVAHLVPSRQEQANARTRLGDPTGSFSGWEVDEPFGTDLALVFTSDRPIFGQRRPTVEQADAYLSALAAGIRQAQAQGGRIVVRAQVIETVPRR